MKTIIVLLIIAISFYFLLPWLSRVVGGWLRRRAQKIMMNKMEDMLRSATGMPPREKTNSRREKHSSSEKAGWHENRQHSYQTPHDESLIPKEYAVDVEFTEYKEYSEETKISRHDDKIIWEQQEQVTDVEWVEIKEKEE